MYAVGMTSNVLGLAASTMRRLTANLPTRWLRHTDAQPASRARDRR